MDSDSDQHRLPFSWHEFRVTKEVFLNEEPGFLEILAAIWKHDPEFAQEVAFLTWKFFGSTTPDPDSPKPASFLLVSHELASPPPSVSLGSVGPQPGSLEPCEPSMEQLRSHSDVKQPSQWSSWPSMPLASFATELLSQPTASAMTDHQPESSADPSAVQSTISTSAQPDHQLAISVSAVQ